MSARSRSLRAVRVLEQIDNDQARELLQKLSRGAAGAKLTVNANAALERMKPGKTSEKAAATANTRNRKPASASQEDALWADLAGPDAAAAFTTMRTLWGNPRLALALLQERLRPSADPDPSRIPQLIASLDDARFPEREAAMKALASLGKLAGPALRQALGSTPSPEARRRIEQLLERCEQAAPSAETLRSLRAIEVLEQINSPESRQVLEKLTKGPPSAEATREARAAFQRMALRK